MDHFCSAEDNRQALSLKFRKLYMVLMNALLGSANKLKAHFTLMVPCIINDNTE
jgi:hypothetical protein